MKRKNDKGKLGGEITLYTDYSPTTVEPGDIFDLEKIRPNHWRLTWWREGKQQRFLAGINISLDVFVNLPSAEEFSKILLALAKETGLVIKKSGESSATHRFEISLPT